MKGTQHLPSGLVVYNSPSKIRPEIDLSIFDFRR
jgi:hypothetical protein